MKPQAHKPESHTLEKINTDRIETRDKNLNCSA